VSSRLISLFLPSLNGGGAERAMLVFAQELTKMGLMVELVVASAEGALLGAIPDKIKLIDLKSSRMLKAIPRLSSYLQSSKTSAIFSTITHANIAATWAAWHARVTAKIVIRQSNAPLSETQDSFGRMLTSHLIPCSYRRADGIIAVSEGVREQLVCMNPVLGEKTHVLPTPVLTQELKEAAQEPVEHPWLEDKSIPLVVTAGRLKPHKGMLDLLQAFHQAQVKTPARLIILGDGPERKRLAVEISRLGLQENVCLAGFRHNPFPFMKHASVFVLASHYEGLPNVLIQALGLGTPVVATDCESGPAEILESGRWGELVPVGAIEALSKAIERALFLPRQPDAQKRAWERFGAEQAARAYLSVAGL